MAKREFEKHIEIERSIIKKYRKSIWVNFIAAVQEYELIQENDKIAVCISGGKDSSVAAAVCVKALGKENVFGVLMPKGEQFDIDKAYQLVDFLR